jgi:hypothetical protein
MLVDLRDHGDLRSRTVTANGMEEYLTSWERGLAYHRPGDPGEPRRAAGRIARRGGCHHRRGRRAAGRRPWEGSSYANYRTIATEELQRRGYPTFLLDAGVLMWSPDQR